MSTGVLLQGGMMEEWHQKLHNNTSPDDVVICQALLDYIDSGLDTSAYWATLKVSNTCTFYKLNVYSTHEDDGLTELTCNQI
jgi:hypothetical protein